MVLLTYVDESHDANRYWMIALSVAEPHLRPLQQGLDGVVRKAADSYPVEADAELHGHALVQARDDWQQMGNKGRNMVRARIGVYAEAMRIIGAHDVRVIIRGLNLRAYRTYCADLEPGTPFLSPHQLVLRHLLEQVCEHVEGEGELALVIADEVEGADDHRRRFRDYQTVGTGGAWSSRLSCLVDTIHFAPSESSRLLQAADLVAYLHRRLVSGQDHDPRARKANETLWAHVASRVVHRECWAP